MRKIVLDSSVIIALSQLKYLHNLSQVFGNILVPNSVYEEICVKGQGLSGDQDLRESIEKGLIRVKNVKNRILVNALLDPLALGEAEALALAVEEQAEYLAVDDRLARARARAMGLSVIGTLRILRLFLDERLITKKRASTSPRRTEKVRL